MKKKDIEYLQSIALSNITGKSRICSHKNIEEKLHEMFIFHKKDYYVRPHRHFNKSESILILEGSADLVLFDEKGDIQNVIHEEQSRVLVEKFLNILSNSGVIIIFCSDDKDLIKKSNYSVFID